MLVFTLNYQVLWQKSMIMLNYTTLMATNDFKNRPILQTCKYRPVKYLEHRYLVVFLHHLHGQPVDGRLEVGLLGVDHDADVELLRHLVKKNKKTFCSLFV